MADYNINAVTRRVVFTGSAGVGPYSFTFEVLDQNDLAVYFNTTKLTLTTDYTVSIAANGTGSVTIVVGTNVPSTPTASDQIVIVGARDIERTTDFVTAGDLRASALNEQLDGLTIFDQQIAEEQKRTLQAPVYDPAHVDDGGTLDMTLPAKAARAGKYLQFNSTTGNPEAGPDSTDVTTIASIATDIATLADIEDGTDATDAIQTVAGISANVTTVAGIASNVTTVAGNTSNINAVAADATDIGTVATNIASVNTVAGNISEVIAVANDLNEAVSEVETVANDLNEAVSEIETVAASISNVDTVGTNIANVNTVAGNNSNVTTVAGISANVTTVAGISGNVTTVAGISADVTTVAADGTDIGTVATNIANVNSVAGNATNINSVAGNSTNINTVAGISADVTTVAGDSTAIQAVAADATDIGTVSTNIANVNTVAGISANVTTVAGDATDIGTVATNLTGSDTIGTVATNIGNVNTVGGSISNVNTVATNISSVNDFADKYRIGSSDPTVDNDEGDLFYNTTTDTLKVYTGTAWEQGVTAGSGFLPTTGGAMTGDITFGDNDKAIFGAGSDLQIYHDAGNSLIQDAGAGDLILKSNGAATVIKTNAGNNLISARDAGSVGVFHNGSEKLTTTSGGIDVTGTVTADEFVANSAGTLGNSQMMMDFSAPNGRLQVKNTSGAPSANMYFLTTDGAGNTRNRVKVDDAGDFVLYADNGTTEGFFWDASTQRLGLGTTAPAGLMEVKVASGQSGATQGYRLVTADGGGYALYPTSAVANPTFLHNVNSGESQAFGEGGFAHMTIASGGNVGIGTASPSQKAHIYGGSLLIDNGSSAGTIYFHDTTNYINLSGDALQFANNGAERMRIQSDGSVQFKPDGVTADMTLDASGNLLVGKTSVGYTNVGFEATPSSIFQANAMSSDSRITLLLARKGTDGTVVEFRKNTSAVGYISVTGSGTTYNTTSDIRLKTDIAPISDATDKLMAMNAVTHKWKADPDADAVVGFIAQEMAEIMPEAVSKGDSEDDMWSMDYGRITPVLVAALQDAVSEIKTLKERVAELEAK